MPSRDPTHGQHERTRPDLAAMTTALNRSLVAAELPVLAEHGLTMWGYVVLLALDEHPLRTQAALAEAIGADKTRIIGVLDDLQDRGLIDRQRDPADRRARLLSLTADGHDVRDSAQAAIRRGEERLLARLPERERAGFVSALIALSALPVEDVTGRPGDST
ncbi:MarR family transcriptional regulator [Rhodococcus opacus PD630]|uniref:MarR family winged helix-turn-helix transcriptional regulator n=1 Tax=Rhodococcus TaxID=1827 RepID=UPI00029CD044|nr:MULTISPECIES: MarR family transcriptional regulator [Rhodococcus]KXF53173.1 MarR family transcriptional regulator [Rhodococcus sp. SC4]RZK84581.1 MAG: MarR family transcriptional regulator [Rhodococcus sp. (in: high G+C Gram-positive bacteria)]AHK30575.1 Putative transcriptional regulatory protein for hcr operon [Rhodococcus opacus PD630]EHI46884.1 MarR family transcriptional regulator [Rhodococcus opacus PD630]KXX54928.1 MarR family transcriptional regulator [Rhodococcus sp. LB1]